MSQSTTMTIRLEPELKSRLDKLSAATHRSKSFLAAEAVREFIEINEWQIEEIKDAVKEADAGDFASDQEVQAVFNKWGVNGD
jgi:RHH-type rel operon transcriptional repressor/antitoxin RelB